MFVLHLKLHPAIIRFAELNFKVLNMLMPLCLYIYLEKHKNCLLFPFFAWNIISNINIIMHSILQAGNRVNTGAIMVPDLKFWKW